METDYKKLWQHEQKKYKDMSNLVFELNQKIDSLLDVIKKLSSGELKLEDIKGVEHDTK